MCMEDCCPVLFAQRRREDHNAVDQSTVHLFRKDVIQTHVDFSALGASKRDGFATFRVAKKVSQKASLFSPAKRSSSLPFSASNSR